MVEFLDLKLHVDDPVGAVGVHMANGVWGTIAVGLLANPDAPAGLRGLFYTGDFTQTGIQLLGFVAVAAYAAVMMIITFKLIQKLHGIRADAEDELKGLDISEHGLPSAYADFAPAVDKYTEFAPEEPIVAVTGSVPPAEAVTVKKVLYTGHIGDVRIRSAEIHQGGDRIQGGEALRPQGGYVAPRHNRNDGKPRYGLRYAEGQARVLQRRCR